MDLILILLAASLLLGTIQLGSCSWEPAPPGTIPPYTDTWPTAEAMEIFERILAQDDPLPDSIDWSQPELGRVGSVRHQGKCNSCWAHVIVGLLEGQQAVLKRDQEEVIDLSVQNLIDCRPEGAAADWYNGCNYGKVTQGLATIKNLGGIMSEQDYPYLNADGDECKFNKSRSVMRVPITFGLRKDNSELDLQKIVARYGPVSVEIDATREKCRRYKSGVHYDPTCFSDEPLSIHSVLVVGYGTDENEGDYWLVKNSWGEEWGEGGYIRMARNRDNNCGIADTIYILIFEGLDYPVRAANAPPPAVDYLDAMRPSKEGQERIRQLLEATNEAALPDSIDWRQAGGRVGPVGLEGESCNSGWAFSATGLLEGQQAVLANDSSGSFAMTDLSVQNLIDCIPRGLGKWFNGCDQGLLSLAIAEINTIGGIMAAKDYPYQGRAGNRCKFKRSQAVMSVGSFGMMTNGSETDLQKLVASYGPVAARVDAGGQLFKSYVSGVHFDGTCVRMQYRQSHYVLLVGYGTDDLEGDYWLAKNSWGEQWGENGYIRMARNRDSNCGIADEIYIAVL